jgi:hypothetical protein
MRSVWNAAVAALSLAVLAACAEQAGPPGHPNPIIVREFTYSLGVVTLDPSFGFSLHRGGPAVPPRQRAAGVARAAAFGVADTIAQQLAALGYDVIRSDTATPEAGGRALVVGGVFRQINEGYRRRVGAENSHIAADVSVEYQAAGAAPLSLMNFSVDSRRLPRERIPGLSPKRGADIETAAMRLGAFIAGAVANLARLNQWPPAPRQPAPRDPLMQIKGGTSPAQ